MSNNRIQHYIKQVLENIPSDWLRLTTHRLDIYNEELAKVEFLEAFDALYKNQTADSTKLDSLPTAYDYIRLGHPLSCVLEWTIAQLNGTKPTNIICFSSKTIAILAILRKNALENKKTQINYTESLPDCFDIDLLHRVYGYNFEVKQVDSEADVVAFDGSTVFVTHNNSIGQYDLHKSIDFYINIHESYGSILLANGRSNETYISDIQHVRRRETIAMTPADCLAALQVLVGQTIEQPRTDEVHKKTVLGIISDITKTDTEAILGSSGLSIQYAIMMGLIHDAIEQYPDKAIKIIVPPNCYGGTNDQARRVAACLDNVEILDLPVDGDNDMVRSTNTVLEQVAEADAIPYIIAEIPTNPRVEVPDLEQLKAVLSQKRTTKTGEKAIEPVFILDQTFCPNVPFLKENGVFSTVKTISYSSCSKFPSGGLCTAGYCVVNKKAAALMDNIKTHLQLCDNEATDLQIEILATQMPARPDKAGMLQRIQKAYENTRSFVTYIQETLPTAKINFVSEELAAQGFTPSVFSLNLPAKGVTPQEQEAHRRMLNHRLIDMMITNIPKESKHCVSYGQLKGCYWTIPATSTQGTTKENDKDYIVRVAVSPDLDLEKHKAMFREFIESM